MRAAVVVILALAVVTVGGDGSARSAQATDDPVAEQAGPGVDRFPARARVAAVRRYLAQRQGSVSFALIDSQGRLYGSTPRRTYASASVVKAMLLVSYLRAIGSRHPNAPERGTLGPMIVRSSNSAASAIFSRLGPTPLLRLASRVGMRDFSIGSYWSSARISAADQARFFRRLDQLVPPTSRAYARRLLTSIVPWQRWGFSRFSARAGFRTFFKGGWRRTATGRLVHEVALFERRDQRFSVAVLTDGNPSHEYGTATLRGVAARLFGAGSHVRASTRRAPPSERPGASKPRAFVAVTPVNPAGDPAHRQAGLVDVQTRAPGMALDVRYAGPRNLTGKRLPGYCRPWALLLEPVARDLARVQRHLRRRGLGLKVFDAYRPAQATRALVRWAERSGRGALVGTYIARRSRHNVGSAVDLTLVRRDDGRQLAMGSRYDDLSVRAHTFHARGAALRNRLTLRHAMERFGFVAYAREWWHFEHGLAQGPALDLPLGCD